SAGPPVSGNSRTATPRSAFRFTALGSWTIQPVMARAASIEARALCSGVSGMRLSLGGSSLGLNGRWLLKSLDTLANPSRRGRESLNEEGLPSGTATKAIPPNNPEQRCQPQYSYATCNRNLKVCVWTRGDVGILRLSR